jgi:hypothetical protein
VFAQFDLSWVMHTELECENRNFANLRRKKALVDLLSDEGLECEVTQFVTSKDREDFLNHNEKNQMPQMARKEDS